MLLFQDVYINEVFVGADLKNCIVWKVEVKLY